MRRTLMCLVLGCGIATGALADPSNLNGGVLIAHHPSGMQFSTTPPAGGWCRHYLDSYAIDACEEQVNRIDTQGGAVWFVLAAWDEDKEWRGVEFGLGEYSVSNYAISDHGPCFPSQGLTLPTTQWPGPNEGISLTVTDSSWSGNYLPVYYFAGYAYGSDVVQIRPNPSTGFAGTANAASPPRQWAAATLGAMGMLAQGVSACPGPGSGGQLPLGAEIPCQFPVVIEVAPTNMLVLRSGAEVDTFRAGDRFTLDLDDDTLRVNGVPLVPVPRYTMLWPVEHLREEYGDVPFFQEHLRGQGIGDWNRTLQEYEEALQALYRRLNLIFTALIREHGFSVADATAACLERARESELVAEAFMRPATNPLGGKYFLKLRGRRHVTPGRLVQLPRTSPAPPRPGLSPRLACDMAEHLRRLERPYKHCIYTMGNGGAMEQEGPGR